MRQNIITSGTIRKSTAGNTNTPHTSQHHSRTQMSSNAGMEK
jgi:hypothetical protein